MVRRGRAVGSPPLPLPGMVTRTGMTPRTGMITRMSSTAEGAAATSSVPTPAADAKGDAQGDGKPAEKVRVLSGVQPTGSLTLGNYLGAIRQVQGVCTCVRVYVCNVCTCVTCVRV